MGTKEGIIYYIQYLAVSLHQFSRTKNPVVLGKTTTKTFAQNTRKLNEGCTTTLWHTPQII